MKKFQIEKTKFDKFIDDFNAGKFPDLRLGQAFYHEMQLQKMSDQVVLDNLFEKDGEVAIKTINRIFEFN